MTLQDIEKLKASGNIRGYTDSGVKAKPKVAKYRNKRIVENGITHHSKKEYLRFKELQKWQQLGLIEDLKRQVTYLLIEDKEMNYTLSYVADFVYQQDGMLIVEDVKPFSKKTKKYYLTPLFEKKAKLMLKKYGITIKIY